ncbi:MAG: glucuronate isomerase [Oscillospiraceae bacterium]|nr:glucuronate isomerase [Oscillospiraceae bacterium]
MESTYLLPCETARRLYGGVKDLPVYDYHCHLSPRAILEDAPFDNLGEMWLSGDHYKWRLMRAAGVPEDYVTGEQPWASKFQAYAETIALAAGSPLYHWSRMELSQFFGIDTPLNGETAGEIWNAANRVIRERGLSPRKLMRAGKLRYAATTDDPADSLQHHEALALDSGFDIAVTPSFRVDNIFLCRRADYAAYIQRLSFASGIAVTSITQLEIAIARRLDDFTRLGCRFADIGIPYFPARLGSHEEAEAAFAAALAGKALNDDAYAAFVSQMYLFLGEECAERGITLQMHLAVARNVNSPLFEQCGPDSGGDCVGDPVPGRDICALLDAMAQADALPEILLYALNPAMAPQLSAIAGSFAPKVRLGAAWWFCDHKRGIREQLELIAETGWLASFPGMLTDSRSFLSYARHDYFRRILCALLAEWVDAGEYPADAAAEIAERLCCRNAMQLTMNN